MRVHAPAKQRGEWRGLGRRDGRPPRLVADPTCRGPRDCAGGHLDLTRAGPTLVLVLPPAEVDPFEAELGRDDRQLSQQDPARCVAGEGRVVDREPPVQRAARPDAEVRGHECLPEVQGRQDPFAARFVRLQQQREQRPTVGGREVVARPGGGVLLSLAVDQPGECLGIRGLCAEPHCAELALGASRSASRLADVVPTALRGTGQIAVEPARDLHVGRGGAGLEPGLDPWARKQPVVELEGPYAVDEQLARVERGARGEDRALEVRAGPADRS